MPHYYLWQDGKPIKEYVDGNSDIFDRYDTLYFLYDENGRPFALIFNGTTYYYVLNLQGDVMRLVTSDGTIVAEYTYDPYGNILTATGDLAQINPLRYRGYYYDTELGMYFLNSRYYDPKVGRFINADDYVSTGQGVLGNNMFAYCGNNPTARKDPDGDAFETAFDIISLGFSVADVIANPSDPWAWAGLAGDLIDVAIPFVGGVGETAKAMSFAAKGADAVDDVYDASKAADFAGGLCFVAGTQVLAEDGSLAIETIQAGDYVWAWDEATGDTALKQVVETYVNETNELVHVFVNGEEVAATPGHPFYSPVKGWTEAVRLRAGDILVLVNGEYVVVEKVQHEILEMPVTVYNFQVEDYHTYFVSECGVLSHNKCSNDFKKIDPKLFETTNNLAEGTFHRQVKPAIIKQSKPPYKVGKNPDILMNKAGEIAYQGAKNKVFHLTELKMKDILSKIR